MRWLTVAWVAACAAGQGMAAEATGALAPAPVIFQSAPGRFEVAAAEIGGAQRVVAQAGEAWHWLAGPLALPDSFASPVFVRLVPAAEWVELPPFRVTVEAGGVVSVRVRWADDTPEIFVRRALVQALLMRQAVARHGVSERLTAPLWLEHACIGWWRTRAEPAQLDALKQACARQAPTALDDVLGWQRGADEPLALSYGALGLLTFLQAESPRGGEWPALLQRLLGGETPLEALALSYPGRFQHPRERELWWQTGWHHLRRARSLPGLEAVESRSELGELARFVFAREGRDAVVPLREVLAHAREPEVDADLRRRLATLHRTLSGLHPFYRNAALSLAEVLALRAVSLEQREASCAAFERDWRDATDLEAASTAALDALEAKTGRSR